MFVYFNIFENRKANNNLLNKFIKVIDLILRHLFWVFSGYSSGDKIYQKWVPQVMFTQQEPCCVTIAFSMGISYPLYTLRCRALNMT